MGGYLIQTVSTLIIAMSSHLNAILAVWPSYNVRLFESDQTPLHGNYTATHTSLVGSLPTLGSVLSVALSPLVADNMGRKRGEILSGLIALLGVSMLHSTTNINIMLAARLIIGLGFGIHTGIHSVFIGEITEMKIRGALISVNLIGYTTGMLTSYIMGWLLSYNTVNIICVLISVLIVICVSFLKETPAFLIKNGLEKEALKSLKFYRGAKTTTQEILDEFESIKALLGTGSSNHCSDENEKLNKQTEETNRDTKENVFTKLCTSKTSLHALAVTCGSVVLSVFMGLSVVQTYAGSFFMEAVPSLSPDVCSIALACVTLSALFLPFWLSQKLGRRVLTIASTILVAVCLFTIGILIRWPKLAPNWVVPILVLVYCFSFSIGVGVVPFMMTAEYFLPEVNSLSSSMVFTSMSIANFVALASFNASKEAVGLDGTFHIYGCVALLTTLLVYLFVPETSGLSTDEIHKLFSKGFLQIRTNT